MASIIDKSVKLIKAISNFSGMRGFVASNHTAIDQFGDVVLLDIRFSAGDGRTVILRGTLGARNAIRNQEVLTSIPNPIDADTVCLDSLPKSLNSTLSLFEVLGVAFGLAE